MAPFATVNHRINLPANGAFVHRVVPDRGGFNVVLTIDYPGLDRRVNNFGPGRAEAFTVRTPNGRVSGRARISGVKGSFGCYTLKNHSLVPMSAAECDVGSAAGEGSCPARG